MTSLYYVKVSYQHFTFKAMIDSGAQITVISPTMVKLLGLKINKPLQGHVHGVGGKAKIIGSIMNCKMVIGKIPIVNHFTVMQGEHDLMIFGLDFLEKYKCILNFKTKTISIDTHLIKLMSIGEVAKLKYPIDIRKIKK